MIQKLIALYLSFISVLNLLLPFPTSFIGELRLAVPEDWELSVGESRLVESVFPDKVTDRSLSWTSSDPGVVTVDEWGRVSAVGTGTATVTAKNKGFLSDSVTVSVVSEPTMLNGRAEKVSYRGTPAAEVDNLQKVVTRYAIDSDLIPARIKEDTDYSDNQSVTTKDGAVWTITSYGVLRTDMNAPTERDQKQRFMGDRYFYEEDTSAPNVLAIYIDAPGTGIVTLMKTGVTHIAMKELSGTEKASQMSATTQKYNTRHGFVSEAHLEHGSWVTYDNDNDGLFSGMYGAGELMRYAVLRDDPYADPAELAAAREAAVRTTEAVLMLCYISARTGTAEAYVRHTKNGSVDGDTNDHRLSSEALIEGGDASQYVPSNSPAKQFELSRKLLKTTGSPYLLSNDKLLGLQSPESWSDPSLSENAETEYARQSMELGGFVARTYLIKGEGDISQWGNIYWENNGDGTATGVSRKTEDSIDYLINGENMRGAVTDASGEVPERLWNDLIGGQYSMEDVIYKGDTSADELIGHMFLYKLAYDILGEEDPELRELIVNAVDRIAYHLASNGYRLVDGTGQPTTWGKLDRKTFLATAALAGAPLHSEVLLSVFKTAAYITGYQRWENEYRLAALDPAYEYAKVMAQYYDRGIAAAALIVNEELGLNLGGYIIENMGTNKLMETVIRLLLNYSDEEMAMLGFYLLFQEEDDAQLLDIYRDSLDQWWTSSMRYSENPLWYYIYQLAYPDKVKTDAYGNKLLDTAAWALSRTPMDMRQWSATNKNRDDIGELDTYELTGEKNVLTFKLDGKTPIKLTKDDPKAILELLLRAKELTWCVAAPDERAVHKFNNSTYFLYGYIESGGDISFYHPKSMEASTQYTLPYWLGRYHGMLSA